MKPLSIQRFSASVFFEPFDNDTELCISIEPDKNADLAWIYLSPNQVNEVINYLAKQLQEIGEPVELLTANK